MVIGYIVLIFLGLAVNWGYDTLLLRLAPLGSDLMLFKQKLIRECSSNCRGIAMIVAHKIVLDLNNKQRSYMARAMWLRALCL